MKYENTNQILQFSPSLEWREIDGKPHLLIPAFGMLRDPHMYDNELTLPECLNEDGSKGGGFNGVASSSKGISSNSRKTGCGGISGWDCFGNALHQFVSTASRDHEYEGEIANFIDFMKLVLDALKDLGLATDFIKKGFILGRAINPDPGLDFILGALGQILQDVSNPNLTFGLIAQRALVVGGESIVTGYASNAAGGLGFLAGEAIVPEGGGLIGLPLTVLITSVYLDYQAWTDYNHENFGALGF